MVKKIKKTEIFEEKLSEVFSPHNNDENQEVEQDIIKT